MSHPGSNQVGSALRNMEELANKLVRVAYERNRERENTGKGPNNTGLPLLQYITMLTLTLPIPFNFTNTHTGTGSCRNSTAPHEDEARQMTGKGKF